MAACKLDNVLSEPSLRNLTRKSGVMSEDYPCNKTLQSIGLPHVNSFDYLLRDGLKTIIQDIPSVKFALPNGTKIELSLYDATLHSPLVPQGTVGVRDSKVYPSECRQRGTTYKGSFILRCIWSVNGQPQAALEHNCGEIPIMVKSKLCNLYGLTPKQLVEKGEHPHEFGGYFIVKGHERLVRMLLMSRRNYPIALHRPSWKTRGVGFTDKGIMIRCVQNDHTSIKNILHFLTNGTVKLMFNYKRQMFYVPVIMMLKALVDVTDEYIYKQLIEGMEDNMYFQGCITAMLHRLSTEGLHTHAQIRQFIGESFRAKLESLQAWESNEELCAYLLQRSVMIHLNNPMDKFNLLVVMIKKLFALVNEECMVEGTDSMMMQEVILGGHVYLQLLKEKLESWLYSLKYSILKKSKADGGSFSVNGTTMKSCASRTITFDHLFEAFLGTGNLPSSTGLGLMQTKGLTVVAENINRMRYLSHFRSVHRGAYFMEMRTTDARQLLPDAWGFICPVHTPDGAPCGLLNHLTTNCEIVTQAGDSSVLPVKLADLGMEPMQVPLTYPVKDYYTVILDGKVLGHLYKHVAESVVHKLRALKIEGNVMPTHTEIAFISMKKKGQYPGIFIFTGESRMIRRVTNLAARKIELIGTLEQVYLDICITHKESYSNVTTHKEISKTGFLSNLANLIPMPDYNQSPRNMYQCQMSKQTMGTPCHTWQHQSETKLYRLQTPASPLFRPAYYDELEIDDFAMATNAIVAVISYTGYDMEDAMIINKSSLERGFAYGTVYKSEFIDLKDKLHNVNTISTFRRDPNNNKLEETLDEDGLPYVGTRLEDGMPYYCFFNGEEGGFIIGYYKSKEDAFIDNVRLCMSEKGKNHLTRVCITYRVSRGPSVGDKFASRAGQKGICSFKWPAEDLPFTGSGLVPDIVFNPHGFPSRMTIAMMIESMAGKSGCLHGLVHNASPFKFTEEDTAINYFGRLLEEAGYNYYGTETLFSGVTGDELPVDIFFGVVHYQRLRHMVSDKWQVRSTGPVDMVTQQPIKGRKKGGGVRFGEMERDSLLSHGASFLLQDRLLNCSDSTVTHMCSECGNLLSVKLKYPKKNTYHKTKGTPRAQPYCTMCSSDNSVVKVHVPYIFRYLLLQLASVNIRVKLDVQMDNTIQRI